MGREGLAMCLSSGRTCCACFDCLYPLGGSKERSARRRRRWDQAMRWGLATLILAMAALLAGCSDEVVRAPEIRAVRTVRWTVMPRWSLDRHR